ncbi:MAG: MFS transporter, partial [Promethearchaeota archaeon]
MFAVIVPIYLIEVLGAVEAEDIAFLTSTVLMPFAIKFIYGMLSDKFALKKLGRRKPWIIIPVSISGLIWILIPFIITANTAFMLFMVGGVIIVLGVAIADTAIDGLILDITPKEKLGRVQGTCWGIRSVGIIIGGPLIVVFYLLADANINSVFIGLGIIMILTSLTILIVKEAVTHVDFSIKTNLKLIFGTGKNWRVYLFAIFNSFVDGVIFVFLSLYIIIEAGFIGAEGAKIELLEYDLYEPNAFISFFIGLGVIIGALIGGYIADLKTRKLGVYTSLLVTSASLLLFLIPTIVPILIFFAFLIGSSAGWR